MFPKDQDADLFVDYTTTQTPATPVVVGPADTTFNNTFGLDYKKGYDVDAIAGYDFGMFRLEGELGYKRANIDALEVDSTDLAALNRRSTGPTAMSLRTRSILFRPSSPTDVDLGGHVSVLSGMVNALFDVGNQDGLSFYAGGGFGRAQRQGAW